MTKITEAKKLLESYIDSIGNKIDFLQNELDFLEKARICKTDISKIKSEIRRCTEQIDSYNTLYNLLK